MYGAWTAPPFLFTSVRNIFRSDKYLASYVHDIRAEMRGRDGKSVRTYTERKKRVLLGRSGRRWVHMTELDLKEICLGGVCVLHHTLLVTVIKRWAP